jgi:hypothetical protein
MSDLSNDTKKHTTKSRETIPLRLKYFARIQWYPVIHVLYNCTGIQFSKFCKCAQSLEPQLHYQEYLQCSPKFLTLSSIVRFQYLINPQLVNSQLRWQLKTSECHSKRGGGNGLTNQNPPLALPTPLSHTIDMAFGDWSCHLWSTAFP